VRLRGYAQKDPKIEYAREGYGMFEEMNARVDQQVVEQVFKMTISEEALERPRPRPVAPPPARAAQAAPAGAARARPAAPASAIERMPGPRPPAGLAGAPRPGADKPAAKVGRNDPCPCGSGKKHKKCCGAA
jgi:preprotein translocase subunit SecA